MSAVSILSLKPIQFAVNGIGLFRRRYPALLRFCRLHNEESMARPTYAMADAGIPAFPAWTPPDTYDRGRELARLLLVVGRSGVGKSTLLRGIHGSFGLLASPAGESLSTGSQPGERQFGEASTRVQSQLDLRVTCNVDGEPRELILSVWTGGDRPPVDWSAVLSHGDAWGAREWARIGFRPGSRNPSEASDGIGLAILDAIRRAEERRETDRKQVRASGNALAAGLRRLPVSLSVGFDGGGFDASRNSTREAAMSGATYRVARDCPPLADSGVGDLFDGLDDARVDAIVDHLTAVVTAARGRSQKLELSSPRDAVPAAPDHGARLRHLGGLSRGERALLSLHANVLARATQATLVLVDDLDLTFPSSEMPAFSRSLARLARAMPGVTFVAAVHDLKSAQAFDLWDREPGLGVAVVAVGGFHER
ncbi:hypothetical protein MET9862_00727 [Methylobacterium symbioticum]|uniref:Uncharacterized protein n=2 Tax=Methylobacterium symbioticum TaxID=2584084 RepID=A0A509E921_9HYPH|nr:hypothetical protein MET9862_00727 [Methylobacterium symbioticum]